MKGGLSEEARGHYSFKYSRIRHNLDQIQTNAMEQATQQHFVDNLTAATAVLI